jgi:rhamnose transport system ATP-binding protein
MADDPHPESLVRLEAVSRSFGAIKAVDGVSFDVRPGEVHGLCGHNGAGKSTVVKILTGQLQPDDGTLLVGGEPLVLPSPQQAQRHGIAFVDQELSVVPVLSVSDNVLLGGVDEPFWRRSAEARTRTRGLLDTVGLQTVEPGDLVEDLSIGERQQVEIARALGRDARMLILDEPTATLSSAEIEHVFAAIRSLTEAGRAVVFVSHRLDEVMRICDRVTVLRDGRLIDTVERANLSTDRLVSMMLGDVELAGAGREPVVAGSGAELVVDSLQSQALDSHFHLRTQGGTIHALAGQIGSGASAALRALAGLRPEARGRVSLDGRPLPLRSPRRAADAGVAYLSNDRKGEGLFLGQSIEQNLLATRLAAASRLGVITRARVREQSRSLATAIGLAPERLQEPVEQLSGGNQQKVLLGRCLERRDTRVLLLDDPTRGVDVRGRVEIHELIRGVAAQGAVVIFTSTELDEILELADRITVMRAGRVVSELERNEATAHALLGAMTHGVAGVAA